MTYTLWGKLGISCSKVCLTVWGIGVDEMGGKILRNQFTYPSTGHKQGFQQAMHSAYDVFLFIISSRYDFLNSWVGHTNTTAF